MTRPVFDWPKLVRIAEAGNPEPLADALYKMGAWHKAFGPKLTANDLHPKVLTYLKRQAQPTGKGGRKGYSNWERCLARQSFELWRGLARAMIPNSGTVEIGGKHWKLKTLGRGTPTDVALHLVSMDLNRSWLTVRDMVYLKRAKP